MVNKRTSRVWWGLSAILAVVLLGWIGLLGGWLRPYWVAKYRGHGADLHGAVLIDAPLPGADLAGANLRRADLHGANLRESDLMGTDLSGADLTDADLRTVTLRTSGWFYIPPTMSGAPTARTLHARQPIVLQVKLSGARYNAGTRWPDDFDPARHGAKFVR